MTSIIVGTNDFRAALCSVLVHAGTDPELPDIMRVRLDLGRVNVTVTASDRFTAGMAIVSVLDELEPPGERDLAVDLLPSDVSKLLAFHKGGKDAGDDGPQWQLRLDVEHDVITVTDCSGMIDGRAVRLPRLPVRADGADSDSSPITAVVNLIVAAHRSDPVLLEDFVFNGVYLGRFVTAYKSYAHPLVFEARLSTKALLIRCGESFLGLAMPMRELEESIAERKQWAESWSDRLNLIDEFEGGSR